MLGLFHLELLKYKELREPLILSLFTPILLTTFHYGIKAGKRAVVCKPVGEYSTSDKNVKYIL